MAATNRQRNQDRQAGPTAVAVARFDADVTPPPGAPLAYDPVRRCDELTLRGRGVVLLGAGAPVVLCALDWLGISNEGHERFRALLAEAAGTTPQRVALHTVHQHDAPMCDFTAEALLRQAGVTDLGRYEGSFHREAMGRVAEAVHRALPSARRVTHYGWGTATVDRIASNRRILGPDGKVRQTRYTACPNAALRAEPEGLIDPELSLLSFWNDAQPVTALSYYACHPQSYYRTGVPSPDFPGIARFFRGQDLPETLHVHFNGAGGNIGSGKYNDGNRANRLLLAGRLAEAMKQALATTVPQPLDGRDVRWHTLPVRLPLARHLEQIPPDEQPGGEQVGQMSLRPSQIAWARRYRAGHAVDIGCLHIGNTRVLHLPGELFVEYQLAAKRMRPELQVALAAYGEYGPAYIGTARAYEEGGYETGPQVSNVAPEVEPILLDAMADLLSR